MRKYAFIEQPKYKFKDSKTGEELIEDAGINLSDYHVQTFEVVSVDDNNKEAIIETGESVLIAPNIKVGDFIKYDVMQDHWDTLKNEANLKLVD